MRSRRFGVIAVSLMALALVAPLASATPGRVDLSTEIVPGRVSWKITGLPDLDQVRATSSAVAGLPGDGKNFCGPTSAVDVLSYLARAGFRTGVEGTIDFAAPDGYDAGTEAVRAMGIDMGTSAGGGTGVTDFVEAFQRHLGRAAAVGTLHAEGGSYRSSDRLAPTPTELAEIGADGAVATAIIGWYTTASDSIGSYYKRIGGHFTAIAGVAAMRPYSTAAITFADPWSTPTLDTTQSPFTTETYGLTMTTVRVKMPSGSIESHTVGLLDGGYAGGQLEGYVALYPERYLMIRDGSLLRFTPKPFFSAQPELERYDLGGAVVDAAFSPRTGRPYALLRNGSVLAVGVGPGGKGGTLADDRIARVAGATALDIAPTGDVVVAAGRSLRVIGVNGPGGAVQATAPIRDVVVEPGGGIVALTGDGTTLERFGADLKRGDVRRLAKAIAALDLDAKGVAVAAPVVRGADAARRDDHGAVVTTTAGTLAVRGGEGAGIVKPRSDVGRLVAVHRAWELFDAKAFPGPIDTEIRSPVAPPPPLPAPQQ